METNRGERPEPSHQQKVMPMTDLPAPLSSADCDLRGYDFMPLYGNRLFGSALYTKALRNPRAGLAAFRLWWAAWQQCPAGSLPSDDNALCHLADFGADLKAWAKVKTVALHGFVRCSDGRLYHLMLCAEAAEAFERRKRDRDRKAKARSAKAARIEQAQQVSSAEDVDVPRTSHGTGCGQGVGRDADVPSDRTGQDRTVVSKKEREEPAGHFPVPTPANETRTIDGPPSRPRPFAMPCRSDPPRAWGVLVRPDEWDIHEKSLTGERVPSIGNYYLCEVANEILKAAGIDDANWRGDWRPLIAWMRDGLDPYDVAIPAIREVVSRASYDPRSIRSLAYFDRAVRDRAAGQPVRRFA